MNKTASELFDQNVAGHYDARNGKLSAITDNLHFLIQLILKNLPADADILCVGAGTGTEILKLAAIYPGWRFTAVEPSAAMLDVCRDNLDKAGLLSRCTLAHGYLSDLQDSEPFDAVLCLLVTQFVKNADDRQALFNQMAGRLKPQGYLINAEISGDMASPEFASLFEAWKAMHIHAGASPESARHMLSALQEHVSILPPAAIEKFLRDSGLPQPVPFFQSLLIHGWYAQKPHMG